MRVAAEGLGHDLVEFALDFVDVLAGSEASAVADAEDMRVDSERFLAERGVEHDICGFAADSGKRLQLLAGAGDFATMPIDQSLAERDDVLRLGVEQADRLDRVAKMFFPEINHLLRSFDAFEERAGCDIDACIRRLG